MIELCEQTWSGARRIRMSQSFATSSGGSQRGVEINQMETSEPCPFYERLSFGYFRIKK